MLEGTSAVFGTVGLLLVVFGAGVGVLAIRSTLRRADVLANGVTVEARCLDTYTSSSGEGSSRHAILSFTTPEGLEVRIQPVVTRPIVAGDFVPVRYAPERPERAFVVDPRGSRSGAGCGLAVGLVVCALFMLVGLFFALSGLGIWDLLSNGSDPSLAP